MNEFELMDGRSSTDCVDDYVLVHRHKDGKTYRFPKGMRLPMGVTLISEVVPMKLAILPRLINKYEFVDKWIGADYADDITAIGVG